MNVGVMKDYKLRDLRASHTLGCLRVFNYFLFLFKFRPSGQNRDTSDEKQGHNEPNQSQGREGALAKVVLPYSSPQ
jgi:hypothetical protein